MKGASLTLASGLAAMAVVMAPAWAEAASETPAGPIGTVRQGNYQCELPGDASGPAGIVQPDRAFTIESSSRYSTAKGLGTYLRRGDTMTFTSGPRRGESYHVASAGFLRLIEDGKPGRLRCVWQTAKASQARR